MFILTSWEYHRLLDDQSFDCIAFIRLEKKARIQFLMKRKNILNCFDIWKIHFREENILWYNLLSRLSVMETRRRFDLISFPAKFTCMYQHEGMNFEMNQLENNKHTFPTLSFLLSSLQRFHLPSSLERMTQEKEKVRVCPLIIVNRSYSLLLKKKNWPLCQAEYS